MTAGPSIDPAVFLHEQLSQEVFLSIRVVAAGRVTAGPSRLLGEDSWEVFVLDQLSPAEWCTALRWACR